MTLKDSQVKKNYANEHSDSKKKAFLLSIDKREVSNIVMPETQQRFRIEIERKAKEKEYRRKTAETRDEAKTTIKPSSKIVDVDKVKAAIEKAKEKERDY